MAIAIAPLQHEDLDEADRIFRTAFGTFLGLPDPASFGGDAAWITTRWKADPAATLGAFEDGTLIGSNFAAQWGSFGFFGPLTVRPDRWNQGIAQRLLEATMALFENRGTQQIGLFTFAHSPKHVGLYQRFGFWPGMLTAITVKKAPERQAEAGEWSLLAADSDLENCRELTGGIFPGLDLEREARALAEQRLGETVLIWEGGRLAGMAICHIGAASEAGSGAMYVKFGAARPGAGAAARFERLLAACEALAVERGAGRVIAGVNTARHDAYRALLRQGFRAEFLGVAMQRPNQPGFNRPDCFVIDDWR
ncbi:MAG: GNAT family N-acetyltransferase [Terriglobales bacterium]